VVDEKDDEAEAKHDSGNPATFATFDDANLLKDK